MPTVRPSMRALGPNVEDDIPENTRNALLMQELDRGRAGVDLAKTQANAADAGFRSSVVGDMRAHDPQMARYDAEQADEELARHTDRMGPVENQVAQRRRNNAIADARAKSNFDISDPVREQTRADTAAQMRDKASMDAFARIAGSIRPETAEIFQNDPSMLERIRRGVSGEDQADVQEPDNDVDDVSAISAGDRSEIEQLLRQNGHLVNDANILAVYNNGRR